MLCVGMTVSWLVPGEQDPPYAKEIAEFKAMDRKTPPPKSPVVFIGSSSFTRWTSVGEAFPEMRVMNRAYGGSSLPDLIRDLDDLVFAYRPRQVVVYCGENDFASDETLKYDVVVSRFKDFFSRVRRRLPQTAVAYVSMKPSPSRWHLAHKFIAANAAIKEFLSSQKQTAFVDVWPVMTGLDGLPRADIFVEDRLHINDTGYELWKPLIRSVLVPVADQRVSHDAGTLAPFRLVAK